MKLLTIIVPSYNMEQYLEKCLNSVIVSQDLMGTLEVLVVNDGSTDRTSEIAHRFEAKWPQTFKVIDKANGNYGSCINVALPIALGVYVTVLDADDYMVTAGLEEFLEVAGEEFAKGEDGADMLLPDYESVRPDGSVIERVRYGAGERPIKTLMDVKEKITVHGIAYRTQLLRKMGYRQSEGKSYTDIEWNVEPPIMVKDVHHIPVVLVRYLVGRENQTMASSIFARNFQQVMDIALGIISRYQMRKEMATCESLGFYQRQVQELIACCYQIYLFGYDGEKVNADVDLFDRTLRQVPELYDMANDIRFPSKRIPLRYVRLWRRKNMPLLCLLRLYIKFAKAFG